jgi:hypothetical protein
MATRYATINQPLKAKMCFWKQPCCSCHFSLLVPPLSPVSFILCPSSVRSLLFKAVYKSDTVPSQWLRVRTRIGAWEETPHPPPPPPANAIPQRSGGPAAVDLLINVPDHAADIGQPSMASPNLGPGRYASHVRGKAFHQSTCLLQYLVGFYTIEIVLVLYYFSW